ncbi:Retrovirus-related Pol polyprotein from transposon TNT 1-94 [Dendrobium catenatum]|uniref:Retrovirus-related Pol polyprotein from transposon TNT 1-94 n=1 Tax=Dendrobium catenatum TaxID=906689 RepID=A0A2I0WGF5_9ASPA|nr:Retrovirus-related Pol polyprotein from transposon TNT 1-94 [Dendrobium catenatum]
MPSLTLTNQFPIPLPAATSHRPTIPVNYSNDLPISSPVSVSSPTPPSNLAETTLPHNTHPMVTRARTGSLKPRIRLNLFHNNSLQEHMQAPTSYSEAVKHSEWRNAMAMEFLALQQQGTWSLVEPPPNSSILGSKWTYRIKRHEDGSIAKYKARLVALGNHQEYGLDYTETFSPVAKLPTIRILLTVALHHDWPVQQLDVANAFLHGTLSEQVFMMQPKGFEDSINPGHVCRLNKAIYGLKQAPRQWYNTFTSYLVSIGFIHSNADPSLLIFRCKEIQIYLLVYVDDLLITGNNQKEIDTVISKLHMQFNMKHLGHVHDFLGLKIDFQNQSYFLSQQQYAESILKQADLQNCKALANPNCTKLPSVIPEIESLSDPSLYRRITGSLQYLTLTRPDIAFSVNQLSQHMHDPTPEHIYLLKRLLRYIKGTLSYGIPIT